MYTGYNDIYELHFPFSFLTLQLPLPARPSSFHYLLPPQDPQTLHIGGLIKVYTYCAFLLFVACSCCSDALFLLALRLSIPFSFFRPSLLHYPSPPPPTPNLLIRLILPLLPLTIPLPPNLRHRLHHPFILLILHLIPLDIILIRNLLDLPSIRIRFVDERFPFLHVEAFVRVEFCLAARDGEVERGAVGHFAVVVEEPEIAAY